MHLARSGYRGRRRRLRLRYLKVEVHLAPVRSAKILLAPIRKGRSPIATTLHRQVRIAQELSQHWRERRCDCGLDVKQVGGNSARSNLNKLRRMFPPSDVTLCSPTRTTPSTARASRAHTEHTRSPLSASIKARAEFRHSRLAFATLIIHTLATLIQPQRMLPP